MSASLNPKKRGLGRGLDALFESGQADYATDDKEAQNGPALAGNTQRKTLGIELLSPNPDQPRRTFDQTALEELAESLKEYGILQPLLVRPNPRSSGNYEIIAGERRWRAAQLAQLHDVPVVIRELTDSEALQIGLVENLQREDLNPVEEALGYRRLIEEFRHTQQKVAELVGKSRSQVTNMLRLLNLPDSVQNMLQTGDLSTGHARALIGRENAEELAKMIIEQDLSVREVEALLAGKLNPAQTKPSSKPGKDTDTRALERDLSEALGMNVTLQVAGQGSSKGQMKVSFKSLDQLDYLIAKMKA
ncbi:MAG: ParB/RepB/Spo0J family partition protein [Rhodospirillales bacterium]|nr:ParB/RepB/Spo0J family partition protein [Rhodospirillales bacterium]MCB9964690.1 ParB/RepB/Spo0J family partition protein [Rhodospirillales bacterium]MCB9979980.1 ParB/RepB/Spo0J family partition protein [Rhodospirillales bacterium]